MKAKKVIFRNGQSPGDILMLTAALRDLHLSHPKKFLTDIRTPCSELWQNNPYLTQLNENDPEVLNVEANYPIIHESNEGSYHFFHGFRLDMEDKLGIKIKATKFWGDIHFSKEELSWISMIHEHFTHKDTPFWLICTGGKNDYTAKHWIHDYAQEVVDHFWGKIQFVQFGAVGSNHSHPSLKRVINLLGATDLRMFMRLMYHADGVICPVTFAMHLAAAMPNKKCTAGRKPCIVTAGGREPSNFTCYTNHQYLHTNGALRCCDNGGCWKSRIVPLKDGDRKDNELCLNTVEYKGRKVQRCMHDCVKPIDVIRALEKYYCDGVCSYLPSDVKPLDVTWSGRIIKS